MKKLLVISFITLYFLVTQQMVFASDPASAHYSIKQYGFGAGGTDTNTHSSSYKVYGTAGEVEGGNESGTNYKAQTGLTFTLSAAVPTAPTLSNDSGHTYDRLKVVLNTGGNSTSDTSITYAFEISTDSTFATNVNYIKSDQTMGSTLTTSDFLTYTGWNGSSGFYVTKLAPGTTYYVRTAAQKGNFSQSQWSPASGGASTANSELTFSLSSSSITFNNLNGNNSYADTQQTILTTSTNAYNGYTIYAKEDGPLTANGGATITDYASPNSAPTTWSGTGFGYTTNDNNLGGTGGTSRFTGGKYAGFATTFTNNPVADDPGPVVNPSISSEQFTITYKVAATSTQKAGQYANTIMYSIVPVY